MSWDAYITLAIVLLVLAALIWNRVGADVVMVGGVVLLMLTGVLDKEAALAGMSNPGMVTVAVLYVVVAGLQETGAIAWLGQYLLGKPRSVPLAQARLMIPIALMSGLLNNTPLVAMMVPALHEWTRKFSLSVSKFLIPLSYASILGGTLTLIGTSTNLVVNGLWIAEGNKGFGIFAITPIGAICLLVGIIYMLTIGRRLIPDRKPPISLEDDPRSYTVEMEVDDKGPLIGKTIEQAGLRHLPGLFLVELDRGGQIIPAVSPHERLEAGDNLVFAGVLESIVDLHKMRGLRPATNQVFKLGGPRERRTLIEAVVSDTCPIVGQTIRRGRFRSRYNAAVIAVARNGERLKGKIGDIVLQAGDTLLIEGRPSFVEQHRNSRDFFLVSSVENSNPPRHNRAIAAMLILVAMVLVAAFEPFGLTMLHAAMIAAGAMLFMRCINAERARSSVDWQVLIVIAAALGLGQAMQQSGLAAFLAEHAVALSGGSPWLTLAVMYLVTMCLTEMITNNAAAALVFPIAMGVAADLGVRPEPFVFAVMMAASASFSTPIGYQTNLMVMGPGGYRFTDFTRVGLPLNVLMWLTCSLMIPVIYGFVPVAAASGVGAAAGGG